MKEKKKAFKQKIAPLRQMAEDSISQFIGESQQEPQTNMRDLLRELDVRQVELEMQNEILVQTRADLESSRDRYIDLYDFAPVGYLTLSESGHILEVNLTAINMLGMKRTNLGRQRLSSYIFRDDQDIYYFFNKKLFETQTQQACEVRLIRQEQDGGPFYVRLDGIQTSDEDGAPVCHLSLSDISEHKAADQALKEKQANLEALLEFTTGIIWSVDRQYRLIGGNERLRKNYVPVLGREIRPGDSALVESMPEMVKEWRGYYERALAGETFKIETSGGAQAEKGFFEYSFQPVQTEDGVVSGVIVSGRDLTEHHLAKAALEQSEARFGKAFFDAPVALNILRASDGKFIEVNDRFIELFGYTRDELIGRTSVELGLLADEATQAQVAKLLHEQGRVRNLEMSMPSKLGAMLWVIISAVPVRMNGEECILGTLLDITERKKAEIERENLIEQLNEVHKQKQMLSARLISAQETERRVMARELHDEVGQALTALKINLQTVQRKRQDGPILAESIDMVEQTLQQVRSISLNLPPTVLEDLGLAPALRWLLDRLGREAGFETFFNSSLGETRLPPQIEITCFRVAQEALTNVMRHAHAHSVKVELRLVEQELHLSVSDDGGGFDVEKAVLSAWQGHSLGLVGMQERVILAGGRMEIESSPGMGTYTHASFSLEPFNPASERQEKRR